VRRWRRRLLAVAIVVLVAPVALVVGLSALYRVAPPPVTALQLIRLAEGYGFERRLVGANGLGHHLPRAVIASEDNRFCEHGGVDWDAFAEQWRRWRAGEDPRGASTVTMQLTRNLFLWPGRDRVRKALELVLAPVVDVILSKPRQLVLYLNQVEFGPGVYGAEAGARHWYGKSARDLTAEEAARLVALLPAPLVYDPADAQVRQQARRIGIRLGQLGPLLDCAP